MKTEEREAQIIALKVKHFDVLKLHEQSGQALRQIAQKIAELEQVPVGDAPASNGSDPAKVETAVPA